MLVFLQLLSCVVNLMGYSVTVYVNVNVNVVNFLEYKIQSLKSILLLFVPKPLKRFHIPMSYDDDVENDIINFIN